MAPKKKEEAPAMGRNSNDVAGELRQFVESIESLQSDAHSIADDIKEKFSEAKGRGFDTKALRAIIAERKKNADDLAEYEAILELYRVALGMGGGAGGGDDEGTDAADPEDADGIV